VREKMGRKGLGIGRGRKEREGKDMKGWGGIMPPPPSIG